MLKWTITILTAAVLGFYSVPAIASPLAYVTSFSGGTMSLVDLGAHTVVRTIPLGGAPWSVAITPDGTRAYVANYTLSTVSVVDTVTNSVVDNIDVGGVSNGVAITPDGARVYVAVRGTGHVAVIDTASGAHVASIPVVPGADDGPTGLAITPDGKHVYVANYSDAQSVSFPDEPAPVW